MNIEDRDARATPGWPSSVKGGGEIEVAVAMAVVPANTPVMTGQTEICITLGEAPPSPQPGRASPGLRQTAELSRLRVGPGIPSCN